MKKLIRMYREAVTDTMAIRGAHREEFFKLMDDKRVMRRVHKALGLDGRKIKDESGKKWIPWFSISGDSRYYTRLQAELEARKKALEDTIRETMELDELIDALEEVGANEISDDEDCEIGVSEAIDALERTAFIDTDAVEMYLCDEEDKAEFLKLMEE